MASTAKQVYRFQFSDECTQLLNRFAQLHQFDHRHDFKSAWEICLKENKELIDREIEFHQQNNYSKDVLKKMYESARFYHRKKSTMIKPKLAKKEYKTLQINTLHEMDSHLKIHSHQKPSICFEHYYSEIQNGQFPITKLDIAHFMKQGLSEKEMKEKLKKTYKNRYYMFIKKTNP